MDKCRWTTPKPGSKACGYHFHQALEDCRQPALALPLAESFAAFQGIVISQLRVLLHQDPSMTLCRRRGPLQFCVFFEGVGVAEHARRQALVCLSIADLGLSVHEFFGLVHGLEPFFGRYGRGVHIGRLRQHFFKGVVLFALQTGSAVGSA